MIVTTLEQSMSSEGTISDKHFSIISKLAYDEAGLMITDSKRQMIESRLLRHMRSIDCEDFDAYLCSIKDDAAGDKRNSLISVLTTNVSSFFREKHHFDTIEKSVLPKLRDKAARKRKIRLWSAGCSSGQEPFSLAMLILEKAPDLAKVDIRILGTDIDHAVLKRAQSGIFKKEEVASLPSDYRTRFIKEMSASSGDCRVSPEVSELVSFRPLNLIESWPMKGRFDVIFCRNVVIYFDSATQLKLWPRFHSALESNGHLFLGHSERIPAPENAGFMPDGVTTYIKSPTSKP